MRLAVAGRSVAGGRRTVAVGTVLVLPQHRELLVLTVVQGVLERQALLDRVGRDEAAGTGLAGGTELVHLLRDGRTLVLERDRVTVVVDRAERLVDLDVLTVRHPLDDAGLDAVLEDLTVAALETQAEPVGDEKAIGGSSTMPIRPIHVIAFREMLRWYAMMSLMQEIVRTA